MPATQATAELPTNPHQLVSKKAAAALLGISTRSVERMVVSGAIEPVKILSRVLFRAGDIERIQRDGLVV